jgi:endonuclease YncB( thermonuclease family)
MPPYGGPWTAEVLRVIDGDTFEVRVRLPFYTDRRVEIRLHDVSAPERSTVAGKAAKAWVIDRLSGRQILIRSYMVADHEDQSFTRFIADVELDGQDFGRMMIAAGFARPGAFMG